MPLVFLPILLIVVPIVEIATFIAVGNWIGLWPTLALVVGSAVVGTMLLRRQGLDALRRIQTETAAGRVPARDVVDGVMIVAAGILLVTPGLVTDVVGYLLFVPAVRAAVRGFFARRMAVQAGTMRTGPAAPVPGGDAEAGRRGPDVVELGRDDYRRRPDAASPWHGSHEGNRTLH